jgi:hypothetical protein
MSSLSKNVIIGSMGASALVAFLAILDLALGFPFRRSMSMDVMFLLCAAGVIYMAYDAYQDLK